MLDESTPSEYRRAFAEIARERPDALIVSDIGDLFPYRQLIVELAEKKVACPQSMAPVSLATRAFNRYARWEWRASVVGIEAATVPAGTFQAFRIEYDRAFTSQQNGRTWTGTQKDRGTGGGFREGLTRSTQKPFSVLWK